MNQQRSERPIIFNGPMVRAILDGRKTQTRRVIKPQPPEPGMQIIGPEIYEPVAFDNIDEMIPGDPVYGVYDSYGEWGVKCPYGQPGNLLWVRETWCAWLPEKEHVSYRADYHPDDEKMVEYSGNKIIWKPSIHMPKKYARLWLRITNVRVERVQEIYPGQCKEEGIKKELNDTSFELMEKFRHLWDSINAKRGYSWESNPWVWVIEFERTEK